jgi:hypothetical protein
MSNITQELIDKANNGDMSAMSKLAYDYYQETDSCDTNIENALKYWTMAANIGSIQSQYYLGQHFFDKNDEKSIYWNIHAFENLISLAEPWHPSFIARVANSLAILYSRLGARSKASFYAQFILSKNEYLEEMYKYFSNDEKKDVDNLYRKMIDNTSQDNYQGDNQAPDANDGSSEDTLAAAKNENMQVISTPSKWIIEPTEKKSVVDVEYYVKGNNKLRVETGWRWASYHVYTEDNNPPKFESHANIYDFGYKVELIETFDNCWTENDDSECDEESQEWLTEFLEDNSVFDLESEGWDLEDTETYFTCDFDIKPA